jgi:hypothetical protein
LADRISRLAQLRGLFYMLAIFAVGALFIASFERWLQWFVGRHPQALAALERVSVQAHRRPG